MLYKIQKRQGMLLQSSFVPNAEFGRRHGLLYPELHALHCRPWNHSLGDRRLLLWLVKVVPYGKDLLTWPMLDRSDSSFDRMALVHRYRLASL